MGWIYIWRLRSPRFLSVLRTGTKVCCLSVDLPLAETNQCAPWLLGVEPTATGARFAVRWLVSCRFYRRVSRRLLDVEPRAAFTPTKRDRVRLREHGTRIVLFAGCFQRCWRCGGGNAAC